MQQEKQNQESIENIDDLIALQEQRLDHVFTRIKNQIMDQFHSIKSNALQLKSNQKTNIISFENLLSITLPLSDKSRRIRQKLNNTLVYKQILMNTQNQLSKQAQLTKQEQKQAKMNFDLICNYKQRQNTNVAGKSLYTVDVCKHLVRKTFKKTAHQIYETISAVKLDINGDQQVKIVCIGGGPGSDLCGIVCHLLELKVKRVKAIVYDYNYDKWESVAKNLGKLMASQSKKFHLELDLNAQWKFIDMTIVESKQLEDIISFQPQIISCCWALNEDIFVKSFWSNLIHRLSNSCFVFLDGNRYPLEYILELSETRKVQYCGFQSPRSLVLHSILQ